MKLLILRNKTFIHISRLVIIPADNMTDASDKIVVFESYDNVIMANLAKTKLDAYGIPCFLTGENFVSLYPIQNELFTGVQLFIFKNDEERVRDILTEEENN